MTSILDVNPRDPASRQLEEWYSKNKDTISSTPTNTSAGIKLVNKDASLTIGEYGPIPLIDVNLLEQLGHFHRERIPERVVHAKGAGAFGYFKVTHAITKYTSAKIFERVGKQTPLAIRFSTVANNMGSSDTVRDPRGFAIKFYTEDGTWDLVGNNTPIFFMRDPILFPMFIHSQKRNPVTNLRDWDMFWDFLSLTPMSIHQVLFLFSERGIPDGYRHMHGYGSHTYSLINKDRKLTWCKFHFKTDQGIKNLTDEQANKLAGSDADYAIRDLYDAIASKKYPSWTFYIQVMTPEQAKKVSFNPFDITKTWPQAQFPLIEVGKIVLDRNPTNYFADVEQIAFSPNNMPPGIGTSPDRLLQGRLFSYQDAQRYRLGVNYRQLPINNSLNTIQNFQRDGFAAYDNQGGAPNYHPNSYGGPEVDPTAAKGTPPPEKVDGTMDYYTNFYEEDNYSQPKQFWEKVLDDEGRKNLVANMADKLPSVSSKIQSRMMGVLGNVHEDLARMLKDKLIENKKKTLHL